MDALRAVISHISKFVDLTDEEMKAYTSIARLTKVRKKQFIVQPGFVCKCKSYIFQGALRSYLIDSSGQDHTILIGIEDWWISDYASFIFQEPATLFVEALEDSILVQIDYHTEQQILAEYPKFEHFLRISWERGLAYSQKRVLTNLSMSAEGRYDDFLERYPKIVQRVPQYVIASYLGISRELLSKIRHGKVHKNRKT
jgi:CRP-like cAMP-binding protein